MHLKRQSVIVILIGLIFIINIGIFLKPNPLVTRACNRGQTRSAPLWALPTLGTFITFCHFLARYY